MLQVVWSDYALNQLADIWARSADRLAVTLATERIDRQLRKAPEGAGESRDQGRRIFFASPLVTCFRMSPDGTHVVVLTIKDMTRPPKP